jgi:2-polyprenyl-6-methoxyphenol hydroxylase-like FAD-dependent oxidoreductase
MPTADAGRRALIVGGGIGGLAAALALRQAGLDVAVFERAPAITEVGAGIAIWANAIHALAALQLTDAIREWSVPYSVDGLRAWNGRVLSRLSTLALEEKIGTLAVVVHRADLLRILFDALGADRVHLGAACTGVGQDDRGVTAAFADGRTAHGDLVIGADGLHSIVRAGLHGQRPPTYAGFTAWRGVVSFQTERSGAGESWGSGSIFGYVPINGGRVYWYGTANAPPGARAADEKAQLLHIFRDWHSPIHDLIAATEPSAILRNDICDRPVLETWGTGRITLVGDAAHPMTPNLGQGACQALEDAVVLGRCVGDTSDLPAALRLYESRRLPRANDIVRRSRRMSRIAQVQNPVLVALRNAVVSRVSAERQVRELEGVVGFRV